MRLLWGPHEPKKELVCFFLPFLGGLAIYSGFSTQNGRSMDYQGHCTVVLVSEDLPKRSFFTSNLDVQKRKGAGNDAHVFIHVRLVVCLLVNLSSRPFIYSEVPRGRDLGVPR